LQQQGRSSTSWLCEGQPQAEFEAEQVKTGFTSGQKKHLCQEGCSLETKLMATSAALSLPVS